MAPSVAAVASGHASEGQTDPQPVGGAQRRRALTRLSSGEKASDDVDYELWRAAKEGNFNKVREALGQGASVHYQREDNRADAFEFKSRRTISSAIHVACYFQREGGRLVGQHASGPPLLQPAEGSKMSTSRDIVELLLLHRADVNAQMIIPGKEVRKAYPIHVAAAAGNVDTMRLLCEKGANPQEGTLRNDQFHYMPIHDATWLNRRDSVACLLELRADVAAQNSEQRTPLHLAAGLGHHALVHDLLEHARQKQPSLRLLTLEDGDELLPVDHANADGRFPPRYLYLFTQGLNNEERARTFLKVATACPPAVAFLLRSLGKGATDFTEQERESCIIEDEAMQYLAPIDKEWCCALRAGTSKGIIDAKTLAKLIRNAPLAASDLIDALTGPPDEENKEHHPIPIRAKVPPGVGPWPVTCAYERDLNWAWESQPWHHQLAQKDVKLGHEVNVRVVHLKGIADVDVLNALAMAHDTRIFAKFAIHALLNYVWMQLQIIYWIEFVHSLLLTVVVLSWWIWYHQIRPGYFAQCMLWSIVASHGIFQFAAVSLNLKASCLTFGTGKAIRRFFFLRGYLRLCFGAVTLGLAGISYPCLWPDGPMRTFLLASNSLLHWFNLLFELRAFRWTGQRLLPIANSIRSIGGMIVIMGALLLGFLFAFSAMNIGDERAVMTFKVAMILLTGETFFEADDLSSMDEMQRGFLITMTLAALFIFLACALNIFIAVLGDCYDLEQERMVSSFQMARARICSGLFLGPKIVPPSMSREAPLHAGVFISLLICAGGGAWLIACGMSDVFSPLISALVLVGVLTSAQAVLRGTFTVGWQERYLWLCNETHMEEEFTSSQLEDYESTGSNGRMQRIKMYLIDNHQRTRRELEGSTRLTKLEIEGLGQQLSDMQDRQRRLECLCSEMREAILSSTQQEQVMPSPPSCASKPKSRGSRSSLLLRKRAPDKRPSVLRSSRKLQEVSSHESLDDGLTPAAQPVKPVTTAAQLKSQEISPQESAGSGDLRAAIKPAALEASAAQLEALEVSTEASCDSGLSSAGQSAAPVAPAAQLESQELSQQASDDGGLHAAGQPAAPVAPAAQLESQEVDRTALHDSSCNEASKSAAPVAPAAQLAEQPPQQPLPPIALAPEALEVKPLRITGFMGKLSAINGVYKPLQSPRLCAGTPCWRLEDMPYFLFHSGKKRWVISGSLGDSTTCYAYIQDDGTGSPDLCRGVWMRCDDQGQWRADGGLRCDAFAPRAGGRGGGP